MVDMVGMVWAWRHGKKLRGSYHEEQKMHWVVVFRGANERQQRQGVWLDAGSLELWTVDSVSGATDALGACDWPNVLQLARGPFGPALSFASNRSAASQVRCRGAVQRAVCGKPQGPTFA